MRRAAAVLLAALGAIALLLPDGSNGTAKRDAQDRDRAVTARPELETCLADAVAAERAEAGVPELTTDSSLVAGARLHAADMARTGELRHSERRRQYPGQWVELGENVAANGDVTSCGPMAIRLRASAGHHAITVDPKWRSLGIGVYEAGGEVWATVAFGQPAAAATTAPPRRPTTAPRATSPTRACT